MKYAKLLLASLGLSLVLGLGTLPSQSAAAPSSAPSGQSSPSSNASGAGSIPDAQDPALNYNKCQSADNCNLVKNYVNPFINDFLAPLAILSVVIGVIWGAIEFTTSGGDPQRTASGKGHIQKALIGLVVFLFLYALLNWLIPGGLIG